MKRARRWRLAACAGAALGGAVLIVLVLALRPPEDLPTFEQVRAAWQPSQAWLLDRDGRPLDEERLDFSVRRLPWRSLESVSPAMVAAIVDGEDRRFFEHRGVDWTALAGAVRDAAADRRRGASTITMQLASLLGARDGRTVHSASIARKFEQLRLALALERSWSKRQILEAYLNLLGFRGEIQGVGAAALVLAGKDPSGLELPESLILAALLPSPGADARMVAQRACARALARRVVADCSQIHRTAESMLVHPAGAPPALQLAPQLAHALLHRPAERVRTTLDADLQRLARDALARQLARLERRNARDGAVLVVDNASGEVLAYVASAGERSSAAQVDGVRARRQAGSTLKPFLYALAFERRYLTAASLLEDSPLSLDSASGVYLPQDYDRDFKGLVSARTALAGSLNVPAVRTLVLLGVEPLRERLRDLGYEGLTQSGDFYGYSLALGSAEVSLWEQVQAYRALARFGLLEPIRVEPAAPRAGIAGRVVIDPAAAFVVGDILADRAARSITFGLGSHLDTPFWSAVKTGTSKDMRDNWCIGFSARYTVGVWVGNFEGDSMHEVSGVSGAAPAWQEIMLELHRRTPSLAPAPPAGLTRTVVRFADGSERPRAEWFLEGAALGQVVPLGTKGAAARITSPANGMVIALDPDIPEPLQRVPLEARVADPRAQLRLDGALLSSASRAYLWSPRRGAHVLALEAADGAPLDRILFTVK